MRHTLRFRSPAVLRAVLAVAVLALAGCGGGGGGGGGAETTFDSEIVFVGISFRAPDGTVYETPPTEAPSETEPGIGAPLNVTIVFAFDGVPEPPFTQQSLPVYTTPALMDPKLVSTSTGSLVQAKGSYELVGTTVEFHPFVPSLPLDLTEYGAADGVPGLLPGSQYLAVVSEGAARIPNLVGPGGSVMFGTTSNAMAYYPPVAGGAPPQLVSSDPEDGATGFDPTPYSPVAPGATTPTFPDGPSEVRLVYDQTLAPGAANLDGVDVDGDGHVDPMFAFRVAGTPLLVGTMVPADALEEAVGPHAAFPAIAASDPPLGSDPTGDDVVLHAGPLPDPDAGLLGVPKTMTTGADSSLLFMVMPGTEGTDLLTVADHLLGVGSHATLALDAEDGLPAALDTGLADLVGLTTLVDGRLVAFDRDTRRIHELLPTVERRRPTSEDPVAREPLLTALAVGDGSNGFRSEPLDPLLADVLDLAVAPSGRLYALAVLGNDAFPSIVRLTSIDPDANGTFDPSEGQLAEVVLSLEADYSGAQPADTLFVSETELLLLDRSADAIDRVSLSAGRLGVVVADVGAYGADLEDLPGGLSPAVCLAQGRLLLDAAAEMVANGVTEAEVRVTPRGILPMGAEVTLLQRNDLLALAGANLSNADPSEPLPRLGAVELLSFTTSPAPAFIDDLFLEEFVDTAYEDAGAVSTSPSADWADVTFNQQVSGGLRASVGVTDGNLLGDFLPLSLPGYDPEDAWKSSNALLGELDLVTGPTEYRIVVLSTDAQNFPMSDGSTPGVIQPTTVFGGNFVFRDFIIPEGVHVIVKGFNPLTITATGRVEIAGLLDIAGESGLKDDSFDAGFLPLSGGPGGPGGGRGGDGHPTFFDPRFIGSLDQFVTPEKGERGFGPVVSPTGTVSMQQVGGRGGVSTLGYDPTGAGFPKLDPASNVELHRPPGGGGGTFFFRGQLSHEGTGAYLVQSHSTWSPFSQCPSDDKIRWALYGNEENALSGLFPNQKLQCVYMVGTPEDPERFMPGAPAGDLVFKDEDPTNDYIGPGGEVEVLIGGQGGGAGGSRLDSMRHKSWALTAQGDPYPGPPYYPPLFGPPRYSPTRFDARGAGGGGGGGAVLIRSFGDIVVTRTGHIDASGGHGGGAERLGNTGSAGGGGGGSGGAILLHAAESIVLQADPGHLDASYIDVDGDQGASVDVSGGMGRDAQSSAQGLTGFLAFSYDSTRADGGQGGFGLIQMQAGGGALPVIEPGAFAFANVRSELKLGTWTGDLASKQADHPDAFEGNNPMPDELRYIDMLHYREFAPEAPFTHTYYTVNGSYPPVIASPDPVGSPLVNENPPGSGSYFRDTVMMEYPPGSGRFVLQEPEPENVMKTYNGWNPETFKEINNPNNDPLFPKTPGTTYAYDEDPIPFGLEMVEPDGTPVMVEVDGEEQFDPDNQVDRMPVIPFDRVPPPFGTVSRGTSRWLDFQGVSVRARDGAGRPPPFFEPINGTFNAAAGPVPPGKDGQVMLGADVPGVPARFVQNTGLFPFDPGLFGNGVPIDPPFNDIGVDAPEFSTPNAVTDNATVTLVFQGAYGVREGSHVPDPATLSPWVSDLTQLTGYPLVRFQVTFDIGVAPAQWPFGVESFRPQVDYVRLRAGY